MTIKCRTHGVTGRFRGWRLAVGDWRLLVGIRGSGLLQVWHSNNIICKHMGALVEEKAPFLLPYYARGISDRCRGTTILEPPKEQ